MVLPAHAGMIPKWKHIARTFQSAPRACGDDPSLDNDEAHTLQCSPRMRG